MKEDFDYWWSEASHWVHLSHTNEERVRTAFRRVLSKMPSNDREKFLSVEPMVLCSDHKGLTDCIDTTDKMIPLGIIFLRHDILTRDNFIDTVAHESAHIVLGHYEKREGSLDLRYEQEKAADDLSGSWGFARCYSSKRLETLKKGRRVSWIKSKLIRIRL